MTWKSQATVGIVTGAHLCRNPRVVKEAATLSEAGYRVSVVSPLSIDAATDDDAHILSTSTFERVVSADVTRAAGMKGRMGRIVRRLAGEANHRFGFGFSDELGYGVRRTLRAAQTLEADLYIGHQEVGAWVCWKLMREGRNVAVDLEDWYSRDLLPSAQRGRPVALLDRMEGDLVREAAFAVTTSESMADAMADAFGARPSVIYNAFPWTDRERMDGERRDRLDDHRPSLFWFSQTIGPGRGLETLVDAVAGLHIPVQLHLRGNVAAGFDQQLLSRLGPESDHDIRFHPLVSPSELLSRIAEHDIGLALEESVPPSRDLTVTNKILQYLQAGLAVIATPTSGQRELARIAGEAISLANPDSTGLRQEILTLLTDQSRLKRARAAALEAARTTLSWEEQAGRLLPLVDAALNRAV